MTHYIYRSSGKFLTNCNDNESPSKNYEKIKQLFLSKEILDGESFDLLTTIKTLETKYGFKDITIMDLVNIIKEVNDENKAKGILDQYNIEVKSLVVWVNSLPF